MDIKKYNWLFKRKWYIQGINGVPLLINHAGGSLPHTWKSLGYGYKVLIKDFINDFCEVYYDLESMDSMYDKIKKNLTKNKNYLKEMREQSKREVSVIYKSIEKIKKIDIKKSPNKEFFTLFRELNNIYPSVLTTSHIIEPFSVNSDWRIKELLLKKLKQFREEKNFSKYLTILTSPTQKSELFKATQNLFKIIGMIKAQRLENLFDKKTKVILKEIKKYPKLKKELEKHQEKYFWIASNYAKAKIADVAYFIDEIKMHMAENEDKNLKVSVTKEDKNKLIKKLKISGKLLELIDLIDFVTKWQDERKVEMLTCACYIDLFAKEAAKRFNLNHNNVRYLLPYEITEKNLRNLTDNKLAKRKKGCIVIYTKQGYKIYSNKDHKLIRAELKKHEKKEIVDELTGMSASVGKVVGRASICKSLKDIKSFKTGRVLVSTMTRPEFAPAMKKAIAIVTDEGGITCHAAIVSRELGIPCVIGTKIATKVINNGDLLEVAANHSRVRIIEKTK